MIDENTLVIYTDGSCMPSPRRGGLGIRFLLTDEYGEEKPIDLEIPGFRQATNNQMELEACVMALQEATRIPEFRSVRRVMVRTDSTYVVENRERAMFDWPRRKWLNRYGRPIENADQWKQLVKAIKTISIMGKRVEFEWVKGHSKDVHNKAVDKQARKSAKNPRLSPFRNVEVRRKTTANTVEIGSVPATGQRITIRLISSSYMKVQRLYRYKFEVTSRRSKSRGLVDIAFSTIPLKTGHSYYVVFNKEPKNPRIVRVIREAGSVGAKGQLRK